MAAFTSHSALVIIEQSQYALELFVHSAEKANIYYLQSFRSLLEITPIIIIIMIITIQARRSVSLACGSEWLQHS